MVLSRLLRVAARGGLGSGIEDGIQDDENGWDYNEDEDEDECSSLTHSMDDDDEEDECSEDIISTAARRGR